MPMIALSDIHWSDARKKAAARGVKLSSCLPDEKQHETWPWRLSRICIPGANLISACAVGDVLLNRKCRSMNEVAQCHQHKASYNQS